jgi:hypothetical protein
MRPVIFVSPENEEAQERRTNLPRRIVRLWTTPVTQPVELADRQIGDDTLLGWKERSQRIDR